MIIRDISPAIAIVISPSMYEYGIEIAIVLIRSEISKRKLTAEPYIAAIPEQQNERNKAKIAKIKAKEIMGIITKLLSKETIENVWKYMATIGETAALATRVIDKLLLM